MHGWYVRYIPLPCEMAITPHWSGELFGFFFAVAIQPAYKITLVKVEDNKPIHFSGLLLRRFVGKSAVEGKEQMELCPRALVPSIRHKHWGQQGGKCHCGLSQGRIGIKCSAWWAKEASHYAIHGRINLSFWFCHWTRESWFPRPLRMGSWVAEHCWCNIVMLWSREEVFHRLGQAFLLHFGGKFSQALGLLAVQMYVCFPWLHPVLIQGAECDISLLKWSGSEQFVSSNWLLNSAARLGGQKHPILQQTKTLYLMG